MRRNSDAGPTQNDLIGDPPERLDLESPVAPQEAQIRTKRFSYYDFAQFKTSIIQGLRDVEVFETEWSTSEQLQTWREEHLKQQVTVIFGGTTITITQNKDDQLIWSTKLQASSDLKTTKERKEDIETKQTEYLKHLVALMLKLPEGNGTIDPSTTIIRIDSIQPADDAFIEKTKKAFLEKFGCISYENQEYILDPAGKVVARERSHQSDHDNTPPPSGPGPFSR